MEKEKGAVMIEAVIVLPMVLFTVFFMIYLGLFKLQEIAILYQVQRVAHQGAMVVASPGYQELGNYKGKAIDFAEKPANVNNYYQAYHDNLLVLYREIFGYGAWTSGTEMQNFMSAMGDDTMILAGVSSLDETVNIKRGLFSTTVEAEVTFGFPTPGVLKYFGYDGDIQFKQGASAAAVNPSGFVRNVDLAGDVFVIVSEKLGIQDDLSKIMDGIRTYLF